MSKKTNNANTATVAANAQQSENNTATTAIENVVPENVVVENNAQHDTAQASQKIDINACMQQAVQVAAQQTGNISTTRKLPESLSKSMLVFLLDNAGYSVKQIAAAKIGDYTFNAGHVRNSIRDYKAHPEKQARAFATAKALGFEIEAASTVTQAATENTATAATEQQAAS